ncbi:RNA polymerase sigma factor [Neolewinella persica]|uniref:RNA polymerase sigma factor n=1 Tax=Neolewinella persica TaxID=70998 RepID=UPI000381E9EA|nr:sigma-70 family RNA polymerase sigma factor [Neolewinella persica]
MSRKVDIQLIARCLANNRAAQRHLYDLCLPYLNLSCRRYLINEADLKDALQDTFISVFGSLSQFDVEKASFKTWSTRIAINACLKCNRKRKQSGTQELVINMHDPEIQPEVFAQLSNEDLVAWLKQMPRPYFEVFNFYVIDGFSHQEISKMLDIDPQLSRQRLARSRAWLKKRLPTDLRADISREHRLEIGLILVPLAQIITLFLTQ